MPNVGRYTRTIWCVRASVGLVSVLHSMYRSRVLYGFTHVVQISPLSGVIVLSIHITVVAANIIQTNGPSSRISQKMFYNVVASKREARDGNFNLPSFLPRICLVHARIRICWGGCCDGHGNRLQSPGLWWAARWRRPFWISVCLSVPGCA